MFKKVLVIASYYNLTGIMQADIAVLNAIAERFCPASPSSLTGNQEPALRAPFHEMIAKKPEELGARTPIDSVRAELGLAMNHLSTCESYLQGIMIGDFFFRHVTE